MKRFITRYKTNKILWYCGWLLTIDGGFLIAFVWFTRGYMDKLKEFDLWEFLLIFPVLIHLIILLAYEVLRLVGIAAGLPCFITGVVFILLTAPYIKRRLEISALRRKNGGYFSEKLIEEMYRSGEFNDDDRAIELMRNERRSLKLERSPWLLFLLRTINVAIKVFVFLVMIILSFLLIIAVTLVLAILLL